jgi:hypothetical protein
VSWTRTTIGLFVTLIALAALFIAAKLSPCRKRPPEQDGPSEMPEPSTSGGSLFGDANRKPPNRLLQANIVPK